VRSWRLALLTLAGALAAAASTVLAVAVNVATGGTADWFPTMERHPLRWMAGATVAVACVGLLVWRVQQWYDRVPADEEDVAVTAQVPADGPVRLGSVQLPDGRQLWDQYFDPSCSDQPADAPLLWATNERVPDAPRVWQVLTGLHHDTGLAPILLSFMRGGHEGRPWDEGELDLRCDPAAVDRLDAATVLAEHWAGEVPTPEQLEDEPDLADWFAPFGFEFPGLAPGQDQELTSAELVAALGSRARVVAWPELASGQRDLECDPGLHVQAQVTILGLGPQPSVAPFVRFPVGVGCLHDPRDVLRDF
jgi:hypothetical protein